MSAPLRILYIGSSGGTSAQRFAALARLGHDCALLDPYALLPQSRLASSWSFKTGALGFRTLVRRRIARLVRGQTYDVAFVDNGELLSAATVRMLRRHAGKILLFNQDNPFVARDGRRWAAMLPALPFYDLFVTPRESNVLPAFDAGARNVLRVHFAADEVAHRPVALRQEEEQRFASPIVFVGTWMPERGPFFAELAARNLPLAIWGPRWEKAPEYDAFRHLVRGGALGSDDYVKAIAGADIAIALLSKGNEDLHTTRSLEIPAIGTVLCGERTSEHLAMYEEGDEALLFDTAAECEAACRNLLADPARLWAMAGRGQARVARNGHFNEPTLRSMLDALEVGLGQ